MEKKERSSKKKPLLYIAQPKLREPKHHMQTFYDSATSESKLEKQKRMSEDVAKKRKSRKTRGEEELYIEEQFSIGEEKGASLTSAADYFREKGSNNSSFAGLRLVKSFPSMSIDEKIDYLYTSQPYYSCLFITKEKQVSGKVHSYDGNQVMIQTLAGDLVVVEKDKLEAIRIMR